MKKKGSAIITVIGSISVLMILAIAFISSSREKAGLSRLSSDDKKVEALAESANDYIYKMIKKSANTHDDSDPDSKYLDSIYYLLRAPLKAKTTRDEDNFNLDVSNVGEFPINDMEFEYMSILNSTIKDMGWEGKVEITSNCELVNAESFTPDNLQYRVPTIDYKHLEAEGRSAKFLDGDLTSCSETEEDKWASSDWELRFKFPNGEPITEELTIETTGYEKDVDITVKRKPAEEKSTKINIKAETSIIGIDVRVYNEDIDIQDEMNKSHVFPELDGYEKNLRGFRSALTNNTPPNYNFGTYVSDINSRKTEVKQKYQNYFGLDIDSTDLENDPYFIEKGAVLRITTNVKYKKHDNSILEKNLVSEIPFKVSDVQPIAPEYSFFVANTPNVGSIVDSHVLGEPIEMNKNDSSSYVTYDAGPPTGDFIVHNVPVNDNNTINYSEFSNGRIPGMVRINSNYNPGDSEVTTVKSFLGLKSKPYLTELNKFFTPFREDFSNNKYNTRVSFIWENIEEGSTDPLQRFHEVELPLLFENDFPPHFDTQAKGIKNVLKIFKQGNYAIFSVPTLLFGIGHMEYPLGLRVEGPVNTEYSRLRVYVHPSVDVDVTLIPPDVDTEDETEVWFDYVNLSTYSKSTSGNSVVYDFANNPGKKPGGEYEPATVGMQDFKGYKPENAWSSNNDFQYSPANCYDALQYAKKATKYYKDQVEFKDDLGLDVEKGGLDDGGIVKLNGVYYIKDGDLDIKEDFKYKGHGLIVCKTGDINITSKVERDPSNPESTLGLIARLGAICFDTNIVEAACFSNESPECSTELKLQGNLVCNNFVRGDFLDANIHYDNTMCTVTPFASLRKIGKFEPKRYVVTFADNWSRFSFEKPAAQ